MQNFSIIVIVFALLDQSHSFVPKTTGGIPTRLFSSKIEWNFKSSRDLQTDEYNRDSMLSLEKIMKKTKTVDVSDLRARLTKTKLKESKASQLESILQLAMKSSENHHIVLVNNEAGRFYSVPPIYYRFHLFFMEY